MKRLFAASALLSAFAAIAAAPIAMRVEVEPVRASGDSTVMAITVQVAPEDRSRIGTDAWIQGELRHRGERIERLARAVNLDDSGQARIEATWPPGVYQLQIEIEGTKRKGTGVWINTITVPNLANTVLEAESPPTPLSTPVTATTTTASAESPAEQAEQQPTSATTEPVPVAAAVAAAATSPTAADTATASAPPIATDPEVEESPQSARAEEADETPSSDKAVSDGAKVAAAVGAAAVTAAVSDSTTSEAALPEPDDVVEEDTPEIITANEPEVAGENIAAGAAAAAADSSLESESRTPSPEPRVPSPEAREEEPAAAPVLPPVPDWPVAVDTSDLSVMVTDRNRPVVGLDTTSFSLKVAGNDVAIHRIGEGQSAPLNLGLAVGVSETSRDTLDQVVRQLERLALRTGDGRGEVFLAATGNDGSIVVPWGATPEEVSNTVATASTSEQAGLSRAIKESVQAFQGRRGRSFLIVVSDGSDDSSKTDWKEAALTATSAGIPVFVIGLSDTGFQSRTRSNLEKIASVTGGRSYFLANAGMLELTLDYVGELIDGAYVLQFATQPGGGPVKVESGNRNWEVHHPSRIP